MLDSKLKNKVIRQDLSLLQRLQSEFATELKAIDQKIDPIEKSTNQLASEQFSPTTNLLSSSRSTCTIENVTCLPVGRLPGYSCRSLPANVSRITLEISSGARNVTARKPCDNINASYRPLH
jgi:hypothetical protein